MAGILAAMRITKTKLSEHKFLFQGAGEVIEELGGDDDYEMIDWLINWLIDWLIDLVVGWMMTTTTMMMNK